jgi:carbamoyl-phosphate synthase small subunit
MGSQPQTPLHACLILADGEVFSGAGLGAVGQSIGEICFNTAMTGYQEVLTDPSYAGQIITFTFPHIGNVGCNAEDIESNRPVVAGLVLREPITEPSNFRSGEHLDSWLKRNRISGVSGVDTRALTRHIRAHGAQNAAIIVSEKAIGDAEIEKVKAQLTKFPSMEGLELAKTVTTNSNYIWQQTEWQLGKGYGNISNPKRKVVAIDFGEKLNILRSLAERGCDVTVVPSTASADDIRKLKPDGVFLSNGPGDPSATSRYADQTLKALVADGTPIFGICLGHQLLSLALGAKTEKMHQGHRGANHPVKNLKTGAVEITSQNHGFCVVAESLPADVEITHVSLFDGTIEGIAHKTKPVFSVQYHPESSPGPNDSKYLFDQFITLMDTKCITKKGAA